MKRGERGYTLVEVLISTILMAVVVGAVFKLAVTSAASSGNADRRLVANQYSRHLSDMLATFVTGSSANPQLQGPNQIATTAPSAAQWSLNGLIGDDGLAVTDTGGGWALAPGTHVLNHFLPAWFESAPYNAIISYCVAGPGVTCCDAAAGFSCPGTTSFGVSGGTVSLANINVTWTDP